MPWTQGGHLTLKIDELNGQNLSLFFDMV